MSELSMNKIEIEVEDKDKGAKRFEISCSYMERVFYDLFHPQKPLLFPRKRGWYPFTNVYELSSEIVIEVELAGISGDNIRLGFRDNYLVIWGQRKERISGANILYHQLEVEYGIFERIIHIPFEVDKEGIRVYYENGFLTIRLPKICSQNIQESTTTIGVGGSAY